MAISATFADMVPAVAAEVDFTRPADTTAYASGDLVANSATAGSVTPMQFILPSQRGGHIHLHRVRLRKSDASVTNASFRVHFFTSSPVFTNGDNGAFVADNPDDYLGSIDVSTALAFASDAAGWGGSLTDSVAIVGDFEAGATIYAAIEARGAYTPASAEVFTLQARIRFERHGYAS
jgi:hypothetical protein